MKKSKFAKMIASSVGKQVVFDDDGSSRIGKVIGAGPSIDTMVVHDGQHEKVIERKSIFGRIKKEKWFSMAKLPPEEKAVLLESKCGEVKLGNLLNRHDHEFYDLNSHHFHSPYWHKPLPATEFTKWKFVGTNS